jgi:3-deoxy-D-manno-octulosonic-acid transferase
LLAIYYILLLVVGLFAGPFLLLKKKARAGLWQKLGMVPAQIKRIGTQSPLWFHAVSVGEFNALWPLLAELHRLHPQQAIVVSTTTATGQALARQRAGSFASIFYFPFDLPGPVHNWLKALQPAAVLIVETELWPGFYNMCAARKIPLIIVNGRMSPRSFKGYQSLRGLIGKALSQSSLILAQSQAEAARYRDLAGEKVRIEVTGNLKFDGLEPIEESERLLLLNQLALQENDLVIVGGSTHEGEEAALLCALASLRQAGLKPKLILVPRHPERFKRAAELVAKAGFSPRLFSSGDSFTGDDDVYVLDTIGQLMRFYSLAKIAFVGGTLVAIGGHNLVEPCAYAVPVVCGPHVEKTRDVAYALSENNALLLSKNAEELTANILKLASDESYRQELGRNGLNWLASSQGAVASALAHLERFGALAPAEAKSDTAQSNNDIAEVTR